MAALTATLLAAGLGVVSSMCLVKGSKQMMPGEQSYKGQTRREMELRDRNARWTKRGLIGLGAAFLLQAIAAVLSYIAG